MGIEDPAMLAEGTEGMYYPNLICRILHMVHIPEEVRQYKGHLILHISDTPSSCFSCLARLVRELEPAWIIHTGDLVDEVKIGLHRRDLDLYRRKLVRLKRLLETQHPSRKAKVFITLGNHDNEEIVRETFSEETGISDSLSLVIDGLSVNCNHYLENLPGGSSTINLFGHDDSLPEENEKKGIFLNGVRNINIITLPEGIIFMLPYPGYVDDHRQLKHKSGL